MSFSLIPFRGKSGPGNRAGAWRQISEVAYLNWKPNWAQKIIKVRHVSISQTPALRVRLNGGVFNISSPINGAMGRFFFISPIELRSVASSDGLATGLTSRCALIFIYAQNLELVIGDLYETSEVCIPFRSETGSGRPTHTLVIRFLNWAICLFNPIYRPGRPCAWRNARWGASGDVRARY